MQYSASTLFFAFLIHLGHMSFPQDMGLILNNSEIEFMSRGAGMMAGILFALLGGAFITLQGVANSHISQHIGTWQAATITQFTGFVLAFILLLLVRDGQWRRVKQVKPIYLAGGALAAIIISSNITAIHQIGVTLTIAMVLIAQLSVTFIIDSRGWFGVAKQKMKLAQFIGIGMMIAGVIILKM